VRRHAVGNAAGFNRPGRRLACGQEKALIAAIFDRRRRLKLPDGAGGGIAKDLSKGRSVRHRPGSVPGDSRDGRTGGRARQGGHGRDRHGHRPVAWPHGNPHRRAEGGMGAGETVRDRPSPFRAFPVRRGALSTQRITRSSPKSSAPARTQFDLYVFRSFARSFWTVHCAMRRKKPGMKWLSRRAPTLRTVILGLVPRICWMANQSRF
jgi:hypothetical protein